MVANIVSYLYHRDPGPHSQHELVLVETEYTIHKIYQLHLSIQNHRKNTEELPQAKDIVTK